MRTTLLFLILVSATAGCLRKTEFKCMTSAECSGGGVCEANGYCSFADSACTSGRRYSEFSGSVSSECVGGTTLTDGGVDSPLPGDGQMGGCPAGYNTLPNAGTHRYKLTTNAAMWSTQRDRCAMDGTNVYLAIPDNQAELVAITTASAAARTFIGINDIATEGTFVTVKGGAATYLPWDTANNEPDNGMGGQNCVSALMATPNIATERCADTFPAVCECEP